MNEKRRKNIKNKRKYNWNEKKIFFTISKNMKILIKENVREK